MKLKFIILSFMLISCGNDEYDTSPLSNNNEFILAADISQLPKIESKNLVFYNQESEQENMLTTLKKSGVNTIRLKLFHTPEDDYSGFEKVKEFADEIHDIGLKVWLTVHYSDTWADPGHQSPPKAWENLEFDILKDSLFSYTEKIVAEINPEFIQIGNEINPGILLPQGKINANQENFKALLQEGVNAVRVNNENTKIILHFAGINGANWFFNIVKDIDYDIMGISYYPIWHGKDLKFLESEMSALTESFNKDILIAETAYPFSLGWNDWTNNIVGIKDQLILPDFPANPNGQKAFMIEIINIVKNTTNGIGVCYWGAELVAHDGSESTTGSPWENQAFYDFNNRALPIFDVFSIEE